MYLNPETLSNQFTYAPGLFLLTPEQEQLYIKYSGFIKITNVDPLVIEADIVKWEEWKAEQPDLIEKFREAKLQEISNQCEMAIIKGTEIKLSNEKIESFTYNLFDQSNISEMFNAVLLGATEYPYHANDDNCRIYSAQDIMTIYVTLAAYKTSQTTYHNQLKQYVKTLTTQKEIEAVVYGQELTGEYLEKYNELMAQAKVQLDNIIAKVGQTEALNS